MTSYAEMAPNPPATPPAPNTQGQQSLLAELRMLFPWMDELGLDVAFFQNLVAESASPEEMVIRIRQEPNYRKRFPGLWRPDGSIRMTEAEYLQTEKSYRQLLRQSGIDENLYKNPSDLQGLFESEQDPNELARRLEVYRNVRDAGQGVRDAFFAYAGIDLTVDDLFEAVVDKDVGARLAGEYNEKVQAGFDYTTFMDRVTTLAQRRASDLVSRTDNVLTIRDVPSDPGLSRQILDLLYTSGEGVASNPLSLEELLASYEEALLGAAAQGAGLGIPTKERIAQIRAAGIDRARAQQAYLEFGRQAGTLSGASQRAGMGAIDRSRFEDAAFLGDGSASRALDTAQAIERAAGRSGGSFRFAESPGGGLIQRGLT